MPRSIVLAAIALLSLPACLARDAQDRCAAQCPAAGGTVEHAGGLSGVTITIAFDGSDSATWSSSRGRSGTLDLACGG
ncbi:hypothetical protein [Sorangium sp. So ce542]|uniref:hypothetical protein n=1 Tax=Sorangium sp. So ce542 TaxID=3133316 RepID=UPI003F60B913